MQSKSRHRLLISLVLATSLLSAIFLYSRVEVTTIPSNNEIAYTIDEEKELKDSFLPDVAVAKMIVDKVIEIVTIRHL